MSIRSHYEYEKLRAIGRIVRLALDRARAAVRPGVTTRELDEAGARVLAEHGAESAPPKVYGFPGALHQRQRRSHPRHPRRSRDS
jgi:methionyl aminopeptidase